MEAQGDFRPALEEEKRERYADPDRTRTAAIGEMSFKKFWRVMGNTVDTFVALPDAKTALGEGNYDVVICDGSIHTKGDGIRWAEELDGQGQKVVLLSGDYHDGHIPFSSDL